VLTVVPLPLLELLLLLDPLLVAGGRCVFNCRACFGPVWLFADGSSLRSTTAAIASA